MPTRESNFERTGKHRAMVVDDNPDIGDVVKQILERALPVAVDTATSGVDALRMLAEREYDVVLCDYQMPGMDGLELLRRAQGIAPGTTRIMITGATDFSLAVQAINEGAIAAFFPKPIDSKTLVQKVGGALDAHHQAILKERGNERAAQHFRGEMSAQMGKDVAQPFTGSLSDSTRR